jgi:AcrR family transcriptional regulator
MLATNRLVATISAMPPRTRRDPTQARQHILNAALAVLQHDGISGFTLERIAQHAGLSKAGVLHHFPSKDAVAAALVEAELEAFSQMIDASIALEKPAKQGRWSRAYIHASFQYAELKPGSSVLQLYELAMHHPSVIEASRPIFQHWIIQSQQDGLDPVYARILMHAVDNCVFELAFGLAELDSEATQSVRTRLLAMTRRKQ